MKKIKEINASSVLTRSKLPKTDYCVNPYTGCLHKCVYCYARFMRRFTSHAEPWGDFLDIKGNAAQVLDKELVRAEKGLVLLSSVTDPYQPIEAEKKITRGVLEKLLKHQFPVSILTKSTMVLRDLDLLRAFQYVEVGITITSTKDSVSRDFEPAASRAQSRIEALRELKRAGIRTYAFIGPVLPGLTDLEGIFDSIAGSVDKVMVEALNPRCGNWDEIQMLVERKYPEIADEFKKNTYSRQYWDGIEARVRELCARYDVPLEGFFVHGTSKM